jgi:hypothetical protein
MRSLGLILSLAASVAAAQDLQPGATLSATVSAPQEPSAPPPPVLEELSPSIATTPAFAEHFLAWNPKTNTASVGVRHAPLGREEFYALVGRPELSLESERARTRRVWLFVGAGAALSAGTIAAVAMWTTLPNMNSRYCAASGANYNGPLCADQYKTKMAIAPAALVAGVAGAALLATLAIWSTPDVLTGDAAQVAVSRYNAGLKQRVARSDGGVTLRLSPLFLPSGGGLLATGGF